MIAFLIWSERWHLPTFSMASIKICKTEGNMGEVKDVNCTSSFEAGPYVLMPGKNWTLARPNRKVQKRNATCPGATTPVHCHEANALHPGHVDTAKALTNNAGPHKLSRAKRTRVANVKCDIPRLREPKANSSTPRRHYYPCRALDSCSYHGLQKGSDTGKAKFITVRLCLQCSCCRTITERQQSD